MRKNLKRSDIAPLSAGEEATILNALGPEYGLWMRIALLTGLRLSEQLALRWVDVDLWRGTIRLAPKSGREPYVRQISPEACEAFRQLSHTATLVFPAPNGTPFWSRQFLDTVWRPAVDRSGLVLVPWRALRQTFFHRRGSRLESVEP